MARTKKHHEDTSYDIPPAATPEARESQLVNLAMNEAELRIRNHTATSQLLVHYLKIGTENAKLEREKLRAEVEHTKAKTQQIANVEKIESLYNEAISAMRRYNGQDEIDDGDYDD